MFHDVSINDVLKYIKQSDYVSDFAKSLYEKHGMVESFVFVYNYIRFDVGKHYFYNVDPEFNLFDITVPVLRLDLSGKALDYLRSFGWDFYEQRCLTSELDFHVTRCDWAFDLVDYKPEFLDQLIDHLQQNQLKSGRVPLISSKGAVKYELKLGSQKTVYLGSSQSDKMLRVYDKKLQLQDAETEIWKEPVSFPDCKSWLRIEYQTRNYNAHGLVMPGENFQIRLYDDILKLVFETFAFADASVDVRQDKRTATEFWTNLFPWEEVRSKIIQNAKYVEYKDPQTRLYQYFSKTQIPNVVKFIHTFGWDEFLRLINSWLNSMYDPSDPFHERRFSLFTNALLELGVPVEQSSLTDRGLWLNCGRYVFTLPKGVKNVFS